MKILCLIYLSVTPLILSFEFLQGVNTQIMKLTRTIIHQLIILQCQIYCKYYQTTEYVRELKTNKFYHIVINMLLLKKFDPFANNNKSSENKFYRSPLCILLSLNETCTKCLNVESNKVSQTKQMTTKQSATNLIPTKSKAPISKLSDERIKMTLQYYRIENKAKIEKIEIKN